MIGAPPPLRFLAVVLAGYAAIRTAFLLPLWFARPAEAVVAAARDSPAPARARPERGEGRASSRPPLFAEAAVTAGPIVDRPRPGRLVAGAAPPPLGRPAQGAGEATKAASNPLPPPPPRAFPEPASGPASTRRWTFSAWAFVRTGDRSPLAAGGTLGASQAGVRLGYRLNRDPERPIALALRLTAPVPKAEGSEAALGLTWKPGRRTPVHLVVERRQALGRDGRSAFAAGVYGGIADARLAAFRIDAYAQAGIVGARSRDAYADGAVRLSLPLGGRAGIGGGAWAAAQPGLSRLDLGPQATLRLPVAGCNLTLAADWRVRVAGNARPGSGPTLTLGTDF